MALLRPTEFVLGVVVSLLCAVQCLSGTYFNVANFGAKGDGVSDDTQAFLKAWSWACRTHEKDLPVILIPKGKTFVLNEISFQGPCTRGLIFRIQGTLASSIQTDSSAESWIQFTYVENIIINGHGTIDGRGQQWWDCRESKRCSSAPNTVSVSFGKNLLLQDIQIMNSPGVHVSLFASNGITIQRLKLNSPVSSPNTDGIHMGLCNGILVSDSSLATGDDCVALVDGNSDIKVEQTTCGPGHGISIGSLGRNSASVKPVSNVVVDGVTFRNSDNGVRIKTWQGGRGSVSNVVFSNIRMDNVANPIIIDQFYCGGAASGSCNNQTNAIKINNVTYSNIKGTTHSDEAIRLACSSSVACTNIVLENIELRKINERTQAKAAATGTTYFCNNVYGKILGTVVPRMKCLNN